MCEGISFVRGLRCYRDSLQYPVGNIYIRLIVESQLRKFQTRSVLLL